MQKHKQLVLANPESVRVRLAKYTQIDGDCWIWQGTTDKKGYGYMGVKDAERGFVHSGAHRVAYLLEYGELPPGMHLHHKCHRPPCVNPTHLELATAKEHGHAHKGDWGRKKQDACNKGHGRTVENTLVLSSGARVCRICNTDRQTAWKAENPDKVRQYSRDAYRRNPLTDEQRAKRAARSKAWREANPDRYAAAASRQKRVTQKPSRTECTKGLHPWIEENIIVKNDGRSRCRPCGIASANAARNARLCAERAKVNT